MNKTHQFILMITLYSIIQPHARAMETSLGGILRNETEENIIKTLATRIADINAVIKDRLTCGNPKCEYFCPHVLEERGMAPLHYAAARGMETLTQKLLEWGANIDAATDYKETPLHIATKHGYINVVKLLVSNKASINARNKSGQAPLHFAVDRGDVACTKFLLTIGADPEIKDDSNRTPLHIGAWNEQAETTMLLIENGVHLDPKDSGGNTPLHASVVGKRGPRVAQILLDAGANIEALDSHGQTPLHHAAASENIDCLTLLLAYKAQVDSYDCIHKTPLFSAIYALHHKDEEKLLVIQKLLESGANPCTQDCCGHTPDYYGPKDSVITKFIIGEQVAWKSKHPIAASLFENGSCHQSAAAPPTSDLKTISLLVQADWGPTHPDSSGR